MIANPRKVIDGVLGRVYSDVALLCRRLLIGWMIRQPSLALALARGLTTKKHIALCAFFGARRSCF